MPQLTDGSNHRTIMDQDQVSISIYSSVTVTRATRLPGCHADPHVGQKIVSTTSYGLVQRRGHRDPTISDDLPLD